MYLFFTLIDFEIIVSHIKLQKKTKSIWTKRLKELTIESCFMQIRDKTELI